MKGREHDATREARLRVGEETLNGLWQQFEDFYPPAVQSGRTGRARQASHLSACPAMILAQNAGMFASVYPTASLYGQAPLRIAPAVVQRTLLTRAIAPARRARVGTDVYHLLALIGGFIAPPGLSAGAGQGFMVYFLRLIHGKFYGSNEFPSFVERIPPAITGTMRNTLEPAMTRCRR